MVLVVKDKNKKITKHHKLLQGKFLLNLMGKPKTSQQGTPGLGQFVKRDFGFSDFELFKAFLARP